MEICKDAAVKGIGTPDGEELALINALSRRELGADEVYTFALRLCDNDIDRDFERFGDETLDQLAPLFVGVAGVFDHQWSARGQTARIYRTQVVGGDGTITSDGRPCRYLKGWAYMMRTQENAALIAEIDGGIKRERGVRGRQGAVLRVRRGTGFLPPREGGGVRRTAVLRGAHRGVRRL